MFLTRYLFSLFAFTILLMSCDTAGPEDEKIESFSFQGNILGNKYSLSPDNNAADNQNWQYGYSPDVSSFSILFLENDLENIFIYTKKLDFQAINNLDELFKVGYKELGEIDYDFCLGVTKYFPDSHIVKIYSTNGPQDETSFYISNVEKYELEAEKLFGYKITASITAKLYDELSNDYVGKMDGAEFIFGIVFPTNK